MCYLLHAARQRAFRRGLPFEISVDWALHRLVAQHYRCARTDIPLQLVCPRTNTTYNAFSPSFDRVDSDKGYTADNVQLVCFMYNSAKNRFSSEDVLMFAEGLLMQNSIVIDNSREA